jgi:hypothetical protein
MWNSDSADYPEIFQQENTLYIQATLEGVEQQMERY